jgi:acyl-CoA reductase-like NAD-dependent aldehyde dehydrogenase
MAKIRVGDPLDKNTDLGAINSREQLSKIQELASLAMQKEQNAGAQLVIYLQKAFGLHQLSLPA